MVVGVAADIANAIDKLVSNSFPDEMRRWRRSGPRHVALDLMLLQQRWMVGGEDEQGGGDVTGQAVDPDGRVAARGAEQYGAERRPQPESPDLERPHEAGDGAEGRPAEVLGKHHAAQNVQSSAGHSPRDGDEEQRQPVG